MATPVEQLSFIPTGASLKRSLGDWSSDICNVKCYGAVGDGVTDDTAAIQRAFNDAFGPISSPSGGVDGGCSPVFFPAGNYLVVSPAPLTVTGAGIGTGGRIKLTVASTATLLTGYTVLVQGVLGTTEANGVWGIVVDDSTHITLYNESGRSFINTWTAGAGQTVRTSALHLRNIKGAHIYGSGRAGSTITNNTDGGVTISTNGCDYTLFENLRIANVVSGAGVNFELFCDGQQGQTACQGNSFKNIYFIGGEYGLRISGLFNEGQMGSETTVFGCHFQSNTLVGLLMGSYNALQCSVFGGNCQGCGVGLYSKYGTISNVHGMGFQLCTVGILLENSGAAAGDSVHISGCRMEAGIVTFVQVGSAHYSVIIESVTDTSDPGGTFVNAGNAHVTMISVNIFGLVMVGNAKASLDIRNCNVGNHGFLSSFGGDVSLTNVRVGNPFVTGGAVSGLSKFIRRQRNTRTYDIEATALTDASVIYAGGESDTVTISNASPGVMTATIGTHFLATNVTVTFTTTGSLPSPLVASQTYYVVNPGTFLTSSTFSVASTPSGAAINTTTAGSGVHTCNIVRNWVVGDQITKSNVAAGGSPGWICTTSGPALTDGTNVAVFKALANVAA